MSNDWARSFQELSSRATETYSRFVAHSQELIARIYRGELAPVTLQQQWPQFLQEGGPRLYREFSQVTFDFFKGLLDLTSRYTDDYYRGLLPDSPEPEPAAAEASGAAVSDWTRWYQALNTHIVEQNTRNMARYHKLLDRIASGEVSAASIQDYSRRFVEERGPLFSQQSAELNYRFFEAIMQLNQRFNDELFRRLAPNGNGSGTAEAPVQPVYLELQGAIGGTVTASLEIDNTTSEPSEVSCVVSEFRNTDGTGPAFRAQVDIEPAQFRLRPGETRSIVARVFLDSTLFAPGRNYAATMIVRGQGEQDSLVFLLVRVAEA